MEALRLFDVTKTFGNHTAVDGLSLTVPRGSVYGFIGPNGSGKTTTLRMIMSILLPDSGEIEVLDERDLSATRDRVSYLPEERGLYKKMKVQRLLRYYGRLKGCSLAELDPRIDHWLDRLELASWRNKPVEALSKGMAQKLQLIACIVSEPDLLILDEPFSGLDPVNTDVLKEIILELRDRGTTVVFSTHDMNTAERMCDRIFMIFRGRKVLDGSLDEIQSTYGHDTVRVRAKDGRRALSDLPGVESIYDHGQLQELRVQGDAQEILRRLVQRTTVYHFELAKPSLHDIFVRIARPEAGDGRLDSRGGGSDAGNAGRGEEAEGRR